MDLRLKINILKSLRPKNSNLTKVVFSANNLSIKTTLNLTSLFWPYCVFQSNFQVKSLSFNKKIGLQDSIEASFSYHVLQIIGNSWPSQRLQALDQALPQSGEILPKGRAFLFLASCVFTSYFFMKYDVYFKSSKIKVNKNVFHLIVIIAKKNLTAD